MNPEQRLAAAVVAHFAPAEVFQEVKSNRTGATADIVVKVGRRGWIIECKMALGLGVIWQAMRWKENGAAMVSVAVPDPAKPWRSELYAAHRVLKHWGVGLFYVSEAGAVREVFPPGLLRVRFGRLWDILEECREQHKTFCPAGSKSGQWSEFKQTMRHVREWLEENGPRSMKEIVANVSTHYASTASARRCLSEWLQDERVTPWAVVIRDGSRLLFAAKPRPTEDAAAEEQAAKEEAASLVSEHYKKTKAQADERKQKRKRDSS